MQVMLPNAMILSLDSILTSTQAYEPHSDIFNLRFFTLLDYHSQAEACRPTFSDCSKYAADGRYI